MLATLQPSSWERAAAGHPPSPNSGPFGPPTQTCTTRMCATRCCCFMQETCCATLDHDEAKHVGACFISGILNTVSPAQPARGGGRALQHTTCGTHRPQQPHAACRLVPSCRLNTSTHPKRRNSVYCKAAQNTLSSSKASQEGWRCGDRAHTLHPPCEAADKPTATAGLHRMQ